MTTLISPLRSASLSDYVDLAQSLGLDINKLMRRVGLSPSCLEDPETLVPADAVRELLELSAHISGAEDFALRLAARRTLSNLGPISLVLREEPTPRQALDTLCRYHKLLNATLTVRVEDQGDMVIIREEIAGKRTVSMRQSMELAIGVMFRLLRELAGPQWHPLQVCFVHRAPKDLAAHRTFFGARLDFNQEFNGLVCAAADLQVRHEQADKPISRFAREYLEKALSRQHQSARHMVRQLIAVLLEDGRCTAEQVAHYLNIDRRTIHRHLTAEGTTFSALVTEVRSELVAHHLNDSDLPLSTVAGLLGFLSPSAFSHWYKSVFGMSVTQARRGHKPIV